VNSAFVKLEYVRLTDLSHECGGKYWRGALSQTRSRATFGPTQFASITYLDFRRRFPTIHALQVTLRKRFSYGLSVLALALLVQQIDRRSIHRSGGRFFWRGGIQQTYARYHP